MTEKQGGSDLRANSTVAEPIGDGWFELTGHKWFCTHPVFTVFITLAQTEAGITCFVAERPHPGFRIQRLKDKLGGRCLASSEVEYDRLPARILGEEGRGTAFVVEQLIWTRLDTLTAVTGMMRRVLAEAIWHARHRNAFGAPLAQQPAMVNVLADMSLESEAATAATLRIAAGVRLRGPRRGGIPPDRAGRDEVLGLQARRAARGRGARVPRRQRLCRGGADGAVLPRHTDRDRVGGIGQRDRPRRAARAAPRAAGRTRVPRGVRARRRLRPPLRRAHETRARGARRAWRPSPGRPNGAPAAWSRTWRWPCRRACSCATPRHTCRRPSAPRASARADWPSAICLVASTAAPSSDGRSRCSDA